MEKITIEQQIRSAFIKAAKVFIEELEKDILTPTPKNNTLHFFDGERLKDLPFKKNRRRASKSIRRTIPPQKK